MNDTQLLQTVGQRGLPLLIVYLERRRKLRLCRLLLTVLLRPFVCRVMFDGPRTEVPVSGGATTPVIQTGQPEATLECWPAQGRAV